MYVYVVTHKNLNADRVGEYKGLKCYQMTVFKYHYIEERGYVFATVMQALNFMLKRRY